MPSGASELRVLGGPIGFFGLLRSVLNVRAHIFRGLLSATSPLAAGLPNLVHAISRGTHSLVKTVLCCTNQIITGVFARLWSEQHPQRCAYADSDHECRDCFRPTIPAHMHPPSNLSSNQGEAISRLPPKNGYRVPAARPTGGTSDDFELDSPVDEISSAPMPFMMSLARLISSEVSQWTDKRIPPFAIRPS